MLNYQEGSCTDIHKNSGADDGRGWVPQEVLDTLGDDYSRNYCDPSSVVKKFSEDKKQEEDWDNESDDSPVTFSLLRTNQNTDQ